MFLSIKRSTKHPFSSGEKAASATKQWDLSAWASKVYEIFLYFWEPTKKKLDM
jgi:hypothetical protein